MTIEAGNFTIFELPPYFFFAGIGFAAAVSCYVILLLVSNTSISKKNLLLCLIAGIGVMVGARVFGCLTNIAIKIYNHQKITLSVIYNAGLVFYGGLIGGVSAYLIELRLFYKNQNNLSLINSFAVALPLFHFFGRLGCLFAGCCYGKEFHGHFHINYIRNGVLTENFPVQAFESVLELSIFCFLLIMFVKNLKQADQNKNNLLLYYFFIYSIGRFVLEFFRGDTSRGFFGILSFSQIISIGLFLFSIVFSIKDNITVISKKGVKNESY